MINRLNVKPLSMNKAYRGRRFKTDEYEDYETECFNELPKLDIPEGKLLLRITAAFSTDACDIDNCVKPFLDILQQAYEFNDKRIYRLEVDKLLVPKGSEYMEFELLPCPQLAS